MKSLYRLLKLLCSLLYFYLAYLVALLSTIHLLLALAITVICLGACFALTWVRFTRSGRSALAKSQTTDWHGTVAAAIFLVAFSTAGFTALSAGLYQLGVGSFKDASLHGQQVVDAAYNSYLWHLADAIPLLKIPDTLNWELQYPFTDHVQGALTLGYTIVVIIPLVYTVTQLVVSLLGDSSRETPNGQSQT